MAKTLQQLIDAGAYRYDRHGKRWVFVRAFKCSGCSNTFFSVRKRAYCTKACVAASQAERGRSPCVDCGVRVRAERCDKCRYALQRRRASRVCVICGRLFYRKHFTNGGSGVACSRECGFEAGSRLRVGRSLKTSTTWLDIMAAMMQGQCSECGTWLHHHYERCAWCSGKRQQERARVRSRMEYAPQVKAGYVRCHECHEVKWLDSHCGKNRKFCSSECSGRYSKRLRRRRKYGAHHQGYSDRAIFERDNWACWMCCTPCRPDADALHPLAPTIDHIIPLSKGGMDAPENVACACRTCNTDKGAFHAEEWVKSQSRFY